jgi:hypothetical protein
MSYTSMDVTFPRMYAAHFLFLSCRSVVPVPAIATPPSQAFAIRPSTLALGIVPHVSRVIRSFCSHVRRVRQVYRVFPL